LQKKENLTSKTETEKLDKNEKKQEKKEDSLKMKIKQILNHWGSTIFFTTLTFYALYSDDVRTIATDKVLLIYLKK
jgi:hypothetical protein